MKRKIYKLLSKAKQGLFALVLTVFSGTAYSQTTYTFNYTGAVQSILLQPGTYTLETWGADGGDNLGNGSSTFLQNGGKGGYSKGTYTLASATTVYVYTGGRGVNSTTVLSTIAPGGYNGGGYGSSNSTAGKSSGAGGGGATHIATATGTLGALSGNQSAVRIVAGGGGGAGESNYASNNSSYNSNGGNGGGTSGLQDIASGYQGRMGQGGTQTAGGGGGDNGSAIAGVPLQGIFGAGGYNPAVGVNASAGGSGAGGGGGGWYGGGSGWVATGTAYMAGSGGGGSGYIGGVTNGITIASGQTGFVPNPDLTGNGWVIITQLCSINLTNASTTGPGPICFGNSATITTNAVSNYVWNNGNTNSFIVVSPTVTTSYTLTATSPSNCTASAVITITVDTNTPTVTAITSNNAVCAGGTVTLTASGANTYTWTNGVTNAVTYTPTATNIYTVTGANACTTATATIGVTVNTSPVVLAGVNSPTVCSGSSVTFTSGGTASTYIWTNGVTSGVPYVPAATNNYTLTGTANGCSSITVVGVTVLITPNIAPAVTPTAICLGSTATLSAVGASGYTWSPGTNLNTSTLAVSPPIPTTYTVVRTNGLCATTMTVNLVVNALPLVSATASPTQICAGSGVNLVVTGPITNTWMPGGFTSANFTLFPNSPTCYTVTGSNGNCTATAAVCVTVNPNPPITITSSTNTICEGQSVTLTAGGALTYTWLTSNLNNPIETASPPATTLITVSGTNSFSCTASISQLILVNPVPNMSLTSSMPYLCVGQAGALSISNPSPNVNYSWSNGPTGVSNPVTPSSTTTYTATGMNSITGCSATNTIVMAVYISTFVTNAPSAICTGQSATLSVSGSATSYSWNIGSGIISPSVVVSPVLNTTYNVIGINGSCQSMIPITLSVNPLPNVTATAAKNQICKFEIATITASGANTYTWDTNSNASTLTFTLSVTTTYTVTGTDIKGCSKSTTVTQYVATCIGIQDFEGNSAGINIYPNPNNGSFLISSDVKMDLQLVNALGQEITTFNLNDGDKKEITVSSLPSGIYFLIGQSGDVKVNKKVVIER